MIKILSDNSEQMVKPNNVYEIYKHIFLISMHILKGRGCGNKMQPMEKPTQPIRVLIWKEIYSSSRFNKHINHPNASYVDLHIFCETKNLHDCILAIIDTQL